MNKMSSLGWRAATLVHSLLWLLAFSWCGIEAQHTVDHLAEANFWSKVDVYDAEGVRLERRYNKQTESSLPNSTAATVFVSDFEGVSETCVRGDETNFVSATILDTNLFQFGQNAFFHCLYLKSALVEAIEEAENELRIAERVYVENSRLVLSELRSKSEVSDFLLERNATLWTAKNEKETSRQSAVLELVAEALLSSPRSPATRVEHKGSKGGETSNWERESVITCRLDPAKPSHQFAVAVVAGTVENGDFNDALNLNESNSISDGSRRKEKEVNVGEGDLEDTRIYLALPSPKDMIDRISVNTVAPRAADIYHDTPIVIIGEGFKNGLLCSVSKNSMTENRITYAQVLNETHATCTIPKLHSRNHSTTSQRNTSIDLYYNPMCRNAVDVLRYQTPRIVDIEVIETLRYRSKAKTVIQLHLDKWSRDASALTSDLFLPSCQLVGKGNQIIPLEAEVFQSHSSVICSTTNSNAPEGTYQIGFSLNNLQYTYFDQTITVSGSEAWLEKVEYDSSSDELLVTLHLDRKENDSDVSVYVKQTVKGLKREFSKLDYVTWEGNESGSKIARIQMEKSMLPAMSNTFEVTLVNPEGARIRDNSTKTLWDPTFIGKFRLEERKVLHYNESSLVYLKLIPGYSFQFADAMVRLQTRGGSAISNYHYKPSETASVIRKGFFSGANSTQSVTSEVTRKDSVTLPIAILWQNIKKNDHLTVDLELQYTQNNQTTWMTIPDALQLWGVHENSCPGGFSRLGARENESFFDLGNLHFQLYKENSTLPENYLPLYPLYNPTLTNYSAVAFTEVVWLRTQIANKSQIEHVEVGYQNDAQIFVKDSAVALKHHVIPLVLQGGSNQYSVSFVGPSGQKMTFYVDIHRFESTKYMRSLTMLTGGNESTVLCAHESIPEVPFCIPGSHLFRKVNATGENIFLEADVNTTLTSSLNAGSVIPADFLHEQTFTIGYTFLQSQAIENLTITIDWKEIGDHHGYRSLTERTFEASQEDGSRASQLQAAFPSCRLCPEGFYSNGINSTLCNPCSAGHYSNNAGATLCSTCLPGYYSAYSANRRCYPCLRGLYMPLFGGKKCLECPLNATTLEDGSETCVAVVQNGDRLPSIIVEFIVTLNATELSGLGHKVGVDNITDEHAIGILMKDDTASAFSTPDFKVKPTDIHVSLLEFEVHLVVAEINVTLTPNVSIQASKREKAEAIEKLEGISADKGIELLAQNPDRFFGRTLEAVNGTSTQVDRIMQTQTSHNGRPGSLIIPLHWIISLSIFTTFSCACAPRFRRKVSRCLTLKRKKKKIESKEATNMV